VREGTGDLACTDVAPVQLDLERIAGRRGGGRGGVPAGETEPERPSVVVEVGDDAEQRCLGRAGDATPVGFEQHEAMVALDARLG